MTVTRMKKRSADKCKNNWVCSGQSPYPFHLLISPTRKKGTEHELPVRRVRSRWYLEFPYRAI